MDIQWIRQRHTPAIPVETPMTDAAAMMDHRLRRLSTILWVVGGLFALLATNTPGGRD
jgi:hypothetical protein